jgi:hypothetical protein
MKKLYISLFAIITSLSSVSYAQETPKYGKIVYRLNVGGTTQNPNVGDTSTLDWTYDNYTFPTQYIDTVAMGRNIYETSEAISLNPTVPSYVPPIIFTTERSLGKVGPSALEYNFSQIPAGKKVEVRLYFAEIYFTAPNTRVFDIVIEGQTKLANFDIFSEVGKNVGLMKSYIVTSDGNLDVDFKKVKQSPKINGIEIIEIQDAVVQGVFNAIKKSTSIEAYPNPVSNSVHLNFGAMNAESIKLYDSFGREVNFSYNQIGSKADVNMDGFPKGIYYLHAVSAENETETVRLVKE